MVIARESLEKMKENKKNHDDFVESFVYKYPGNASRQEDRVDHDRVWKDYVELASGKKP